MLGIFPLFATPGICPHSWRLLTSKDYGSFGRHWAGYHGVEEEECRWCGSMRNVPYEITHAREIAERKYAIRNITPERLEHWRKYSENHGPVHIGDGGSVSICESGDDFNGDFRVIERGDNKFFGSKYIFRNGKQIKPKLSAPE